MNCYLIKLSIVELSSSSDEIILYLVSGFKYYLVILYLRELNYFKIPLLKRNRSASPGAATCALSDASTAQKIPNSSCNSANSNALTKSVSKKPKLSNQKNCQPTASSIDCSIFAHAKSLNSKNTMFQGWQII